MSTAQDAIRERAERIPARGAPDPAGLGALAARYGWGEGLGEPDVALGRRATIPTRSER